MQVSKRKVGKKLEKHFSKVFYQVIADIRQTDESEAFLLSLLKETELKMATKAIMPIAIINTVKMVRRS